MPTLCLSDKIPIPRMGVHVRINSTEHAALRALSTRLEAWASSAEGTGRTAEYEIQFFQGMATILGEEVVTKIRRAMKLVVSTETTFDHEHHKDAIPVERRVWVQL